LVLAGGGHTHALLLRRWLMRPRLRPAHTLVTLVSRQSTAFYSGTLPALVAGLIAAEESAIDLRRLCALAGVSFLRGEIVGLDPLARELRLEGRPPLRFDRLSLDVGAITAEAKALNGVTGSVAAGQLVPSGSLAWGDSGFRHSREPLTPGGEARRLPGKASASGRVSACPSPGASFSVIVGASVPGISAFGPLCV
jgi:selenide,water dikinase